MKVKELIEVLNPKQFIRVVCWNGLLFDSGLKAVEEQKLKKVEDFKVRNITPCGSNYLLIEVIKDDK